MKKFVVTLSALLCALCCAFCLTACDDDDKDEAQNIMSAESWVASIDVATLSENYALEISGAQNISVKVADGKYYAKRGGDTSNEFEEVIFASENPKYYKFSRENSSGAWTRREEEKSQYDDAAEIAAGYLAPVKEAKNKYTSFTYNALDKTFVARNMSFTAGTAEKVTVKIDKNKIGSFVIEGLAQDGATYNYAFSDFGSATVTLPADYTEQGTPNTPDTPSTPDTPNIPDTPSAEITPEKWTEIFTAANNFTLVNKEGADITMIVKGDGDTCYAEYPDINDKYIYGKDGDAYFSFKYDGQKDSWTKRTETEESYNNNGAAIFIELVSDFANKSSEFTYQNDKYVAASVTTEIISGGAEETELSNVEITLENDALKRIYFEITEENYFFEITDFGSTEIEFPTDYTEQGTPSTPDTPNIPDTPSAEVTPEKWTEIFTAANNFTLDCSYIIIKMAGETLYCEYPFNVDNDKYIYSIENSIYYEYSWSGSKGRWARANSDKEDYDLYEADILLYIRPFADKFSSFTYSNGKYTATSLNLGDIFGDVQNAEVVFENGALKSIVLEDDGDRIEIADFGSTVINIPTDFDELAEPPTAELESEKWARIFNAADNFTISMSGQGASYQTIKVVGEAEWCENTLDIFIYYKEDTDCFSYHYDKSLDKWGKGDVEEEDYNYYMVYAQFVSAFADEYNNFDYQNGKYTADSITSDLLDEVQNVEIIFDKGLLKSIVFIADGDRVEITDFGTTEIEFPTDYTE